MRAGKLRKLLRIGVVGMLLASLPGYGLAAVGLLRACAQATQSGHSSAHEAGTHDCCPEAASSSPDQQLPGQSGSCTGCLAAGHSCKSSQGMQTVPATVLQAVPTLQSSISNIAPQGSLCGPDGFLRPPDIS